MAYPREVTEPITGLRWIARNRSQALLAWWPVLACAACLALGALAHYVWSTT
jgi:hypothetical protein